jgi:hypothetical protein
VFLKIVKLLFNFLVEKIYKSTHKLNFANHLTIKKSDFDYVGIHRNIKQNDINKILKHVDTFTYTFTRSKGFKMNCSDGYKIDFYYDANKNKYTYTDLGI